MGQVTRPAKGGYLVKISRPEGGNLVKISAQKGGKEVITDTRRPPSSSQCPFEVQEKNAPRPPAPPLMPGTE